MGHRITPAASLTVLGWPPDPPGSMAVRIVWTRSTLAEMDETRFRERDRASAAPASDTSSVATHVTAGAFLHCLEVAAS